MLAVALRARRLQLLGGTRACCARQLDLGRERLGFPLALAQVLPKCAEPAVEGLGLRRALGPELGELLLELLDRRVPLGEPGLGRGEPCPLFLELRLERDQLVRGADQLIELDGIPLGLELPVAGGLRKNILPARSMTSFDQRTQACAEAALARELDPVLARQRVAQSRVRDEAALDEDLTEPLAGLPLSLERVLELRSRKQTTLDEQGPERPPVDFRSVQRIES